MFIIVPSHVGLRWQVANATNLSAFEPPLEDSTALWYSLRFIACLATA